MDNSLEDGKAALTVVWPGVLLGVSIMALLSELMLRPSRRGVAAAKSVDWAPGVAMAPGKMSSLSWLMWLMIKQRQLQTDWHRDWTPSR